MPYIKNTYITNAPVPVAKFLLPVIPGATPAGGATVFLSYHGVYTAGWEVSTQIYVPKCTITRLYVNIVANDLGTASTFTVRKNATDTTLVLSVPATATGRLSATGVVSFAEGDLLSIKAVLGGTAAQNIALRGGCIEAEVETW